MKEHNILEECRKMEKKAIIYTESGHDSRAYHDLIYSYNVKYFCDNNQKMWGKIRLGLKVLSPKELVLPQYKDYTIIITKTNPSQITSELFKSGIFKFEVYDKAFYTEKWPEPQDYKCKPDFLVIGAQKAGTSWLYQNLRCHPEIALPMGKEMHYFDRDISQGVNYCANFKERNKVQGEITPAYSILSYERVQYVRRVFPHVKIIVILRNPLDRAWSMVEMYYRSIGRSIDTVDEQEIFTLLKSYGCTSRSNYIQILENWQAVFPKEQLHISQYADLKHKPKQLLNNIFNFIGVKQETNFQNYPYNQIILGGSYNKIPSKYMKFIQDLYGPVLDECEKIGYTFHE